MSDDQPTAGRKRLYGAPRNWRDTFIARLGETSNITAAAEAADISLAHVYKTRRTEPAFARRWFEALTEGYDNLEMELLARLRAGDSGDAGKPKFDTATAFRCLAAHRESVAREKGRRTLAQEVATIASINEKIDRMRLNAEASAKAVRAARKANRARLTPAGDATGTTEGEGDGAQT